MVARFGWLREENTRFHRHKTTQRRLTGPNGYRRGLVPDETRHERLFSPAPVSSATVLDLICVKPPSRPRTQLPPTTYIHHTSISTSTTSSKGEVKKLRRKRKNEHRKAKKAAEKAEREEEKEKAEGEEEEGGEEGGAGHGPAGSQAVAVF